MRISDWSSDVCSSDLNRFGRVYQVRAQADAQFRSHPEDILQLETRSRSGQMVPLSAIASVSPSFGPEMVVRYNGSTAADIHSGPAPGYSSDQAQAAAERIEQEVMPRGVHFEWYDLISQLLLGGQGG